MLASRVRSIFPCLRAKMRAAYELHALSPRDKVISKLGERSSGNSRGAAETIAQKVR